MNKKQVLVLALAMVTFALTVYVNMKDLISVFFSNEATVTAMVDPRPMLVELVIEAIMFGTLFVQFKTPNKRG
jgi:hypothetical protein